MSLASAALVAASLLLLLLPHGAAGQQPWDGVLVIRGDAELDADHGVTGGSGTPDDPYVIAGWRFAPTEPAAAAVDIAGITARLVVEDLSVSGTGAALPTGIRVADAANVVVRNVTVEGIQGPRARTTAGILLQDVDDVSVHDVSVHDGDGGAVTVEGAGRLAIERVVAEDLGFHGIWIDGADGGSVSANRVARVGFNGIYLCNSGPLVVEGNEVRQARGMGADLTNVTGSRFSGNMFEANGQDGLRIILSDATVVTGNVFAHNGGWGIFVESGADTTAYGNVFQDNARGNVTGVLLSPVPAEDTAAAGPAGGVLAVLAACAAAGRHRMRT